MTERPAAPGETPSAVRDGLPAEVDGRGVGGCAGGRQAVELLDRAQHVVVGDALLVPAWPHHRSDEECRNSLALVPVVLVVREDQQAVVRRRPPDVPVELRLQPDIALRDRPVVHVVPNLEHDMHDGTIAQGDAWLKAQLDGYIRWAASHNSLLIFTFDEDDGHEGQRIPTLFVGPMVRPGRYEQRITHYDVLRTIEEFYGLASSGAAANAATIDFCWQPVADR